MFGSFFFVFFFFPVIFCMSFKNTFPGAMTWSLLVQTLRTSRPQLLLREPWAKGLNPGWTLRMTCETTNPRHQKIIYLYSNWWIFEGHETEMNYHNYETWDSIWILLIYLFSIYCINVVCQRETEFIIISKWNQRELPHFWPKLMESCSPIHKIDQKTRFFPNISGQLTRENERLWRCEPHCWLTNDFWWIQSTKYQSTKLPGGDGFLGFFFKRETSGQRCSEMDWLWVHIGFKWIYLNSWDILGQMCNAFITSWDLGHG